MTGVRMTPQGVSLAIEVEEGRGLQLIFTKPTGERFVVRWGDVGAALTFMEDFTTAMRAAWPAMAARAAEVERASSKSAGVAFILGMVAAHAVVPCGKGHLHAGADSAAACDADPKMPPMVGPVKH